MTRLPHPDPEVAAAYRAAGWWGDDTLAACVARHRVARPDGPAFVEATGRLTWADYDDRSTALAGRLVAAGIAPGDLVAAQLPDTATVHVAFLACEKVGATVVGIGARAGPARGRAPARAHRRDDAPDPGATRRARRRARGAGAGSGARRRRRLPPELDVGHDRSAEGRRAHQNRWFYFHQLAVEAGRPHRRRRVHERSSRRRSASGCGPSHVTPTILGAPCVVVERFDAEGGARADRAGAGDGARAA